MRWSSLNPGSMLFGPIFQKEVRTSGRRRGTYIFRALYVLALLTLVGISFEGMRNSAAMFSGVQRLQNLQSLAPNLALIIVWFQFVALTLAAPIFTGPCICDEKRARTLSALLTTPLTAAQIVYGKLTSRLVQLVILGLMATPLLLAIRVFGGLNAEYVVAGAALSISTAVLGASLGLMYSTWHRRGTSAAVFATLTLLLVQAAPSVIEGILYYSLNELGSGTGGMQEDYKFHQDILVTCAPATLGMITAQVAMGGQVPDLVIETSIVPGGTLDLGPTWGVSSVYNLVLAFGVTLYSTFALRRIMVRDAAGEGAAGVAPRKRRRKERAAAAATLPTQAGGPDAEASPVEPEPVAEPAAEDGSRERESREVADNPVLWREVRQATFGSRKKFAVIGGVAVAALLFLYWRVGFYDEGLHQALAVVGALAIMLQPVFMTTGSIAGEREARTWEVLLSTPMTSRSILLGKMAGALRAQWFLPALILGHFVVAALTGHASPLLPLHLLLLFAGPVLMFTATGQLYSLLFRKSTTAAVCNLVTAIALWMGSWVAIALTQWFLDLQDDDWIETVMQVNFCLNPVAMATAAVDGGVRIVRGFGLHATYSIEGPRMSQVGAGGFTLIVSAVFGAQAMASFYIFSLTAMLFPRLGGRAWSARQAPEEGMPALARIATGALFVCLAGGAGYLVGRVPGAATGIVAVLGILGYMAARRRAASAPDQDLVQRLAGDVGHGAAGGGVADGDQQVGPLVVGPVQNAGQEPHGAGRVGQGDQAGVVDRR